MLSEKSVFALFFGNRGFFPASLISGARDDLSAVLKAFGHNTIMLDQAATRDPALAWCISGAKEVRRGNEDAPELPLSLGTPRR